MFLELLSLCSCRHSNCTWKTHIQTIRNNFFCQVDIFQLLYPMLIHVVLPSVLLSHLSHQRNIMADHNFRPCKALLVKAVFSIQKEWPSFWQLLIIITEELKIRNFCSRFKEMTMAGWEMCGYISKFILAVSTHVLLIHIYDSGIR